MTVCCAGWIGRKNKYQLLYTYSSSTSWWWA